MVIFMSSNMLLNEFNRTAEMIRESGIIDVGEDDIQVINESTFVDGLLPLFRRIANDETKINLSLWHAVAGNPYLPIRVNYDGSDELLFMVPPILSRMDYNEDNARRAMAVIDATNPETNHNTAGSMVASDVLQSMTVESNQLTGIHDADKVFSLNMAFGLAMFYRYGLPWFVDPATGKRYTKDDIQVQVTDKDTKDAAQDTDIDFGDMEPL